MKLPVRVDTYLEEHPILETSKTIDYSDKSDRIWLTQHLVWAFHNSRSVVLAKTQTAN